MLTNIAIASGKEALADGLAQHVARLARNAVVERGLFTVALSGGSLPKVLSGIANIDGLDWDKWHVFFADERIVPLDSDDSNYKPCSEELFSKTGLPRKNIHVVNPTLSPAEVAKEYEKQIYDVFGTGDKFPTFDAVLLGMGPDGHTASLFPGHPLLKEHGRVVAEIEDSPKPPPARITLTYPVLNKAREVVFVTTGEGKAERLAEFFQAGSGKIQVKPDLPYPAAHVAPTDGVVTWYMDEAAAANLPGDVKALAQRI